MSLSKPSKRSCVFNDALQKEFKFIKLDVLTTNKSRVVCKTCGAHFSVSHGGRNDITNHAKSSRHTDAAKAVSNNSEVTGYFIKSDSESEKISAQEGLFAYHTIVHGHSFRSNDCLSKLVKKLYEPKYSSAKTKTEAIVCNVLAPFALREVEQELAMCNSVSVSLDASNRKAEKCCPVLVRYFLPFSGVQVKMINFTSLGNETSETQCKMVQETINAHKLEEKVVALCADNTNTNFGGVARKGNNNVWRRLQDSLGKEIIGVGCGAHIVHNCLQTAVDCLPFDIESFAVKVYKYFHIYTVRTEELKDFCQFAGIEYSKLLEHGNTRFLSLGPAVDRIIKIFDGLKSYFLSQEKSPMLLVQLFQNPCFKLWLMFASSQIVIFQETILNIEKEHISAAEVAWRISSLKSVMKAREEEGFIPTVVNKSLIELQEEGEIDVNDFTRIAKSFYKTCFDYLEKWENSSGGANKLQWTLLQTVPPWNEIQSSIATFSANQIKAIHDNEKEETKLFDQWQHVKKIVAENLQEWNKARKEKKKTPVEDRWKQVFSSLSSQDICYDVILKIVEFALCLPGTSAPVERVFSLMNNIWSAEKSRMQVETVKAMLMVRINFNHPCESFYDMLLKNKDVLKKISSTQKYVKVKDKEAAGPSSEI